ncbi:TPA: hypothetical protein DCG61_01815 [Patescibacteria group bacterium]|jgi:RNA polymerase sigma-70 factor (ECF subfamily)|nr:hypothetical protein [Patescibacteria group bacterium]
MQLTPRQQFERDYELYSDAMFRFLYFRVRNRERALELTQDVFTRFWHYLSKGNQVEHPRAFLFRSARNAFINEIRTDKNTTSLDSLVESGLEIAEPGPDIPTLVTQKEAVDKLQKLDSRYREVLIMRYVDGMAVKEIAEILNEKQNTISVWIKRGLEKFKQSYE